MRPERDPLKTLAGADPLRDGERLTPEQEREADALLAQLLATPPAGADRHGGSGRRVRRWTLAAAAVVCTAAAVLVATSLIDSEAPGAGIVERAVAAVTRDDAIYHVVERTRAELSYAPDEDTTIYNESWHTTDGRVHQRTFAARDGRMGRLLHDFAGRRLPGRRVNPVLSWEASSNTISGAGFRPGPDTRVPFIDAFNDPGTQLRALEAEGRLRVAGETRVGGRQAYRLVSGPVPHPRVRNGVESVEYLVDAGTYLPLARTYSSLHRSTDPEHPISRIVISAASSSTSAFRSTRRTARCSTSTRTRARSARTPPVGSGERTGSGSRIRARRRTRRDSHGAKRDGRAAGTARLRARFRRWRGRARRGTRGACLRAP